MENTYSGGMIYLSEMVRDMKLLAGKKEDRIIINKSLCLEARKVSEADSWRWGGIYILAWRGAAQIMNDSGVYYSSWLVCLKFSGLW